MKKKFLKCDIHGLTLFRCKRKCWQKKSGKDKSFGDEYPERCFKCISEGKHIKAEITKERRKHFQI